MLSGYAEAPPEPVLQVDFPQPLLERFAPDARNGLLQALALYHSPAPELAILWPRDNKVAEARPLLREARRRYRPNLVMAGGPEGENSPPLLADRVTVDGLPAGTRGSRIMRSPP